MKIYGYTKGKHEVQEGRGSIQKWSILFFIVTIIIEQALPLEIRFLIDDPATVDDEMATWLFLNTEALELSILIRQGYRIPSLKISLTYRDR